MTTYYPPKKPELCNKWEEDLPRLFLAGSIEMNTAEEWQNIVCKELYNKYVIFNPRRPEWDSSWGPETPELYEQIMWEQNRLKESDVVFFYFDPNTKSPITLLELGQCLERSQKCVVVCPDGYWRKTNVVVTCSLYYTPVLNTLNEGIWRLKYASV